MPIISILRNKTCSSSSSDVFCDGASSYLIDCLHFVVQFFCFKFSMSMTVWHNSGRERLIWPSVANEPSWNEPGSGLGRVEPRFWVNKPSRVEPSLSLRVNEPSRAYIPRLGARSNVMKYQWAWVLKRSAIIRWKMLTAKRRDDSEIDTIEGSYKSSLR